MNNKKILFLALILVALVQLYVPIKMILKREQILKTGKEFKFRTTPIDPTDMFRGKYIALDFKENMIDVQNDSNWIINESIFVLLTSDKDGFAQIKSVSKKKPTDDRDFINAKVHYISNIGTYRLFIEYPFNTFYMEESKAYDAEQIYRKYLPDTNQIAYALVKIKDGEAVLKDVLMNDTSIREIVIKEQKSVNLNQDDTKRALH